MTARINTEGQTPVFAAELIVEEFYPGLSEADAVLEPSCGFGAFLRAIPNAVPAIGVEIDPRRPVWRALVETALRRLGGTASLAEIYREIEGVRPAGNRFWREKIRQVLQTHFHRLAPGIWAMEGNHATA